MTDELLPAAHPIAFACDVHVDDQFLKRWIPEHAVATRCDICGRAEKRNIAAAVDELAAIIREGLERHWGDFNDELVPWGMGYDGSKVTQELLFEEEVTSDEALIPVLIDALPDRAWVQHNFFRLTPSERLSVAWTEFVTLIKHRSRFFFTLETADADDPDAMSPLDILRELGDAARTAGLLVHWPAGTRVFRARMHETEHFSDAWDLAALPEAKADAAAANRMSAAGVPMFYGADTADGAIAEASSAEQQDLKCVSTAEFEALRPLRILDLSAGIDIPSIFDTERGDDQAAMAFLRDFTRTAALRVARDGREHVDYVPTQVVCEFFRSVFRDGGSKLDGIAFPSTQLDGAVCVVLFVANDEVANENGRQAPRPESEAFLGPLNTGPAPLLRLAGVAQTRAKALE